MRHIHALSVATALFLVASTPALANGFYLGGGVGYAGVQDTAATPSGAEFDESDTAYKAFGGYRFDVLPIVSLSGELGYRDLGNASSGIREYGISGFDYSALAGVGLGPIELFARLGGFQYDLDKTVGGTTTSFDGSAPLYGVGVRFSLFGIGVRAEYELIDLDELDSLEMVSVSAMFEF